MPQLIVRETPAPEPIHAICGNPSYPPVPDEPVLDTDNIQGNIINGFSKDFQNFLFYTIPAESITPFRQWLTRFTPFVSSASEVIAFNRLFKAVRFRQGEDSRRPQAVKATWRNISFTYRGLQALADVIPELLENDFEDQAFTAGLPARAAGLGDPVGSGTPGDPAQWVVGREDQDIHFVISLASDDEDDLVQETDFLENQLMIEVSIEPVFRQLGKNLDQAGGGAELAGHEQFGFLDGVSQPGIRGRLSEVATDVLTPRQNPNNRDQGKPGQDLLWPGEFVFGYQKQNTDGPGITAPGDVATAGPGWATNGSFLVFRRLRQKVGTFHQFLNTEGANVGLPAVLLGAKIVGRFPDGTPILRSSQAPVPALGSDDCRNLNFEFQDDTPPISVRGSLSDCLDNGPASERSRGDKTGLICPFVGHIRKAYPRDDVARALPVCSNDDPKDAPPRPEPSEATTQTHRLLRRGIPFGTVSRSTVESPVPDPEDVTAEFDRGLLFFCYQTSIENQFEFVTQNWINNPDFKDPDTGIDLLIGQNPADPGRVRTAKIKVGTGPNDCKDVAARDEWVVPTGGGYFFTPSIDALAKILSA